MQLSTTDLEYLGFTSKPEGRFEFTLRDLPKHKQTLIIYLSDDGLIEPCAMIAADFLGTMSSIHIPMPKDAIDVYALIKLLLVE